MKIEAFIKKHGPLTKGEETLLRGLDTGEVVPIGGQDRPAANAGPERQVRGRFLREVALGKFEGLEDYDARLPEEGVQLRGARITGVLDLTGCTLPGSLGLGNCHFDHFIGLQSAKMDNLFLSGSAVQVLYADRLETRGDVRLEALEARGKVHLGGARIGADLVCVGGKFQSGVNLERARITGTFFMDKGAKFLGRLDLIEAEIGSFCDHETSWPAQGDLLLNRCRYGAFHGEGVAVDAEARIRWLSLQDEAGWGEEFWPQPWEHCAKVLREMGHRGDARRVLIEKEKRQRAAIRARMFLPQDRAVFGVADWLLGAAVAYGHRPLRAFVWLFGLLLIGYGVFATADGLQQIKPNQARVLTSQAWTRCAQNPSQVSCFLKDEAGTSYPRFNAFIYSADTLLPIVDLEMQGFWIPDDRAGGWGVVARVYLWVHIALGWALSLLAVAGFSGLIRTDSK